MVSYLQSVHDQMANAIKSLVTGNSLIAKPFLVNTSKNFILPNKILVPRGCNACRISFQSVQSNIRKKLLFFYFDIVKCEETALTNLNFVSFFKNIWRKSFILYFEGIFHHIFTNFSFDFNIFEKYLFS